MQTYPAERTEILRCERKDEEYVLELQERLSRVLKGCAGDAAWIRLYRWLPAAARLLYYGSAALAGVQTLGEEYLGLVPVRDQRAVRETHPLQRALFVLLAAFGPQLVDQQLEEWRRADERYWQRRPSSRPPPLARVLLSTVLGSLSFVVLQRLHWALFYLLGTRFYSLWKRCANIQFVSLRPESNIRVRATGLQMNSVFRLIGFTALLAYVLSTVVKVRRELRRLRPTPQRQSAVPDQDGAFFCDVCLNAGEPVSTPCGHVYCFDCVLRHSESAGLEASKGQCPQCRFQFHLRHVIPLMNL